MAHIRPTVKPERLLRKRIGNREYLNDADIVGFMWALNQYFESMVEIPRIGVGKRQTIETLMNEEAPLLTILES